MSSIFRLKKFVSELLSKLEYFYYKFIPIIGNGINQTEERQQKIIVSLTSYPKRFEKLDLVIKSIMLQSVKADEIILYLGEDSNGILLPKKMSKLQEKGLRIERREGNLKSYKKYFYAMQEYPNEIVITIDDDLIYEKNMIKLLMESYEKYPNVVSAKRVHRMLKNSEGKIANYNDWVYQCSDVYTPSMELFATSGGGTLFPPQCLDSEAFNQKVFMELCPTADDVWLKFMQILKGTSVVFVKGRRILPVMIKSVQQEALLQENVRQNKNDVYIKNLEKHYEISLADYCNKLVKDTKIK